MNNTKATGGLHRAFHRAIVIVGIAIALVGPASADPGQGPGGPILVITSDSSTFGGFYAEVLRNEGFNEFAVADIDGVNAFLLNGYDVAVLAEMPLSSAQATMFSNWVSSGGNLIAMRPAPVLAGLLGIGFTGSTSSNAYLLIDASEGSPGQGLVSETIQFFGTADRYTLDGAQEVARLYTSASTPSASPAITMRGVGSSGGHAVAFSYDLAKSLVYARQGNPAWAGQERDNLAPIRSDDLYFGNAVTDPQQDWVDLDKIGIPQADEQQRLLGKIIQSINADRKPLPRFWYFPRGEKAVIVMTGDDHANGGTAGRFDQFMAASPAGCSVADWECIRGTSYIFPNTPLSDSQLAFYASQGFEVGLHVNTSCANFSPSGLEAIYDQQIAAFSAAYPSLPPLATQRHHCIVWSDWSTAPKVQLERGMRLDTTYYYWPPSWVMNRPGFFTGSAMPMRFADADGSLIDVYQAVTHMTDESGQQYPFTVDTLLDWALGPEGYFGAFTANLHTDAPQTSQANAVLGTAIARGVPVVSAAQLLEWLDGRNGSSFSAISWNGGTLSFSVSQAALANGLQGYVPFRTGAGIVASIRHNGTPIAFSTEAIKGERYAFFQAATGSYAVTYQADTEPPVIVSTAPADGAAGVNRLTGRITATLDEPLAAASVSSATVELRDSAGQPVPISVSYDVSTLQIALTVSGALDQSATYSAVVKGGSSGVEDLSGNSLAEDFTWSFSTGTGPACPCGVWTDADVPANPSENEITGTEVGVKFTVDFDGELSGIRFYKSLENTGTHVGNLWTLDGQLLASVEFTDETASGWQEAHFDTSVSVSAGTVYVASYYAPNGHFAQDTGYFGAASVDAGVVNLLQDGVSGGNGVFAYGSSSVFPTSSYQASNYWVDVLYTPSLAGVDVLPPAVTSATPPDGASNVGLGSVVAATFSEPVDPSSVSATTFRLRDSSSALVPASVTYDTGSRTAILAPNAPLSSLVNYTATISGGAAGVVDVVGNALPGDVTWSFTTEPPDTTPPSLTSVSPADGSVNAAVALTVVAQFDEALQAASVDGATFELQSAGGAPVAGTVAYDAETRAASFTPTAALEPFTTYLAVVRGGAAGVRDVAGNALAADFNWSFTTGASESFSMWDDSVTAPTSADATPVEVGVKLTVDFAGMVTSIRFYKGPENTGTHVGNLWTATGQLLATATFSNETSAGWQQADFATPVTVTPGVVYVASYHAPNGRYALTPGYFSSGSIEAGPINLLGDAASGGNGVYRYGASAFPTESWQASNYWVDVVFTTDIADDTSPTVTSVTPADGVATASTATVVEARFSEELDPASIDESTFELRAGGNAIAGAVAYDQGAATASLAPNAALEPLATYVATLRGGPSGVRDLAGNPLQADFSWTFTTASGDYRSVWDDSVTAPTTAESVGVEVGVKLTVDTAGLITGLRFYKGTGNGGTHVGNLWTAGGQLLASATFANETATGWQQADFATPVPVSPGNVYVASYHAPQGRYAYTPSYFAASGVDAGPINLLQDGVSGGNGVYRYGSSSGFPTETWLASNYWVDVVFATEVTDATAPTVTGTTPADGSSGAGVGSVIRVSFSELLDPATVNGATLELHPAGGTSVPAAVTYDAGSATAVLAPNEPLQPLTGYVVTVRGGESGIEDLAGNPLAADFIWSFTTGAGDFSSVWDGAVTPDAPESPDANPTELGVKFTVDFDGFVTGVRFYKGEGNTGIHVGNLWAATGQRLATATFTNETPAGWQQVDFGQPVPVSAGTVYIASYYAPSGRYALTPDYFASGGVDAGPVNLLADGVSGGNGVYAYSSSSTFPSSTWQASNYWVDVIFATEVVDVVSPMVTGVTPADGSLGVGIAAEITATFSEVVDAATLTSANVQLRDAGGNPVAADVDYDSGSSTVALSPAALLELATSYTVTIYGGQGGVLDLAGNPLATDFSWSFTTEASAGACSVGANEIVTENCLPGNPESEWDITGIGDPTIQGFATEISVDVGETVGFKIDTDASSYSIDIYRLGYYDGMGARKIVTIEPSAVLPQIQPDCLVDVTTGLIDCGNWEESASWAVPADATSGIYIAKLKRSDTQGASHIVFVVRDDAATSDILFQTSDTTWQAYNNYGGNSLYVGSPAGRAYKVSYNRPFTTREVAGGEDWLFNAEYPMVRWLEANGYDVTYASGADTHRHGSLLLNHKVFLSVGHDEYWSAEQRANVEAARDSGVHLAFISGNELFWKTRWEPSIDGTAQPYRTLVSYKETHANGLIDPQSPPTWTGTWRDPRFSPPADGGRPENALTGTWFRVNAGTRAIQVPAEDGKMRFWRNTSVAALQPGQVATLTEGTLGYEWDEDPDNGFRPPGLIRMSTTHAEDVMILTDWGSTYDFGPATHHLTLYKHPSGALVFGAGTIQWSWGLDGNHDRGTTIPDVRMQQATMNLFADMTVQPASLQPGLVTAQASTDGTPPSSVIASPANGAALAVGSPQTVTGTAEDTGGGVVGGVEVSVDGGATWHPAQGRDMWSYSWTADATGSVTILSRAADDSGNIETVGPGVTVTVQ